MRRGAVVGVGGRGRAGQRAGAADRTARVCRGGGAAAAEARRALLEESERTDGGLLPGRELGAHSLEGARPQRLCREPVGGAAGCVGTRWLEGRTPRGSECGAFIPVRHRRAVGSRRSRWRTPIEASRRLRRGQQATPIGIARRRAVRQQRIAMPRESGQGGRGVWRPMTRDVGEWGRMAPGHVLSRLSGVACRAKAAR